MIVRIITSFLLGVFAIGLVIAFTCFLQWLGIIQYVMIPLFIAVAIFGCYAGGELIKEYIRNRDFYNGNK